MTGQAEDLILSGLSVPTEFVERVPLRFAREHKIVACGKECRTGLDLYTLASAHPDRTWVLDRIAYKLDAQVRVVQAKEEEILQLLGQAYHAEAKEVAQVAQELSATREAGSQIALPEDVLELDDKAPAIQLVHAMLLQAVRQRASDIHIEPGEKSLRVRFRIDGVLYERARLKPEVREAVASRIKVMGRMDIAERRLPQDGSVTISIGKRQIDLRISTLPSENGERVVIRLLDKEAGLLTLEGLGLGQRNLKQMRGLLELAHGIVLVTGPTGCGKTTTLYAMLSNMNSEELNILTLEDPVEYRLEGVSQTQMSEKKGLTFARGLRALVRQDPDVIMVGEIRDLETATIAIQSALTGHLVFSTLHTNDAPSSITRLLDLGVEPYLVASSVHAAIAQRLVRKLCPQCKSFSPLRDEELALEGWAEEEIRFLRSLGAIQTPRAVGCETCFKTGHFGRMGIYEMLSLGEEVRELVNSRAPAARIKRAAVANGMTTLRLDGLRKVVEQITTLKEVRAVTQLDLD